MTGAGRIFWPSPEAGHKILMWGVPSLNPNERIILISEDRGRGGESEWTGLSPFTILSSYSFLFYYISPLFSTLHQT